MDPQCKYTLITGGSLGIGKALARECASRGMNLLLVARNRADLESTAEEIRREFSVRVGIYRADLRETHAPRQIWKWCIGKGYRVNVLINNVGMAGTAVFGESSPGYSEERILVNIHALVLLTRLFLPELKSHPRAYILNTGSLSAYYPIPYKSVYAASKAFVLSFSRALRMELRGSPVSLTLVNPNGVITNTGTIERINAHSGLAKRLFIMEAERIARISIDGMLKGRPVVVPGIMNRLLVLVSRILPGGFRDARMARIMKRELE